MRKDFVIDILLLLVAMWTGVPADAQDKPSGKVKAFVSILPIAYFVERVGGPNVEVSVLVGPGQDPHTFEPTPKLVAKLADAQVLFKMGFPFEETLIKKIGSTFKNVEVVDLQQGIKLRAMTEEEARRGSGPRPRTGRANMSIHEAGDMDQHTWLDPQLAKIQARTIADTDSNRSQPQGPVRKEFERFPDRPGRNPRAIDKSAGSRERQELLCISSCIRLFRRRIRLETDCRAIGR